MPATAMIDARGSEALTFGEQPMETRNPNVVEPVHDVAHHLGRD